MSAGNKFAKERFPCNACGAPCRFRCKDCRMALYCSQECISKYKHLCVADLVEPTWDKGRGRSVVARQDIPKNTEILWEKACVVAQNNDQEANARALEEALPNAVGRFCGKNFREIMDQNSFGRRFDVGNTLTNAKPPVFFVSGSWFNSSCKPNATYSVLDASDGTFLSVWACTDIKAGEEVCIYYHAILDECLCSVCQASERLKPTPDPVVSEIIAFASFQVGVAYNLEEQQERFLELGQTFYQSTNEYQKCLIVYTLALASRVMFPCRVPACNDLCVDLIEYVCNLSDRDDIEETTRLQLMTQSKGLLGSLIMVYIQSLHDTEKFDFQATGEWFKKAKKFCRFFYGPRVHPQWLLNNTMEIPMYDELNFAIKMLAATFDGPSTIETLAKSFKHHPELFAKAEQALKGSDPQFLNMLFSQFMQ